ncbi:hypothetical protein [Streptomyces capparidis]
MVPVGVAGGAVVIFGAVVGGVFLLGGDGDDGGAEGAAKPSLSVPPPGTEGEGGGGSAGPDGAAPEQDPPASRSPSSPDAAVDRNLGVSLPVPDGWLAQETGTGNAYVTTEPFACETGETKVCVSAGAYTLASTVKDPKSAAEKDVAKNAEASYGKLNGHKQVKAEKVTVAGQQGYLVRWQLDVAEGPDGTVQSVAFRSPTKGTMTVVRLAFDTTDKAPKTDVMDKILDGIRAVTPASGV